MRPLAPPHLASQNHPCIWLLSAYRSDSHAWWADWLTSRLTEIDWQVRELPGRHFAWRIRGNPLSWLDRLPKRSPDLILATSMVDLATLRGIHPHLAGVPAIYYFHENQFAYPRSEQQLSTIDAAMVQVYGALAADRVLFNSAYNRASFLQGLEDLLARLPDHQPIGLIERLARKSEILPVPIAPVTGQDQRDPKLIVWNHRWEYDKAPQHFVAALDALAESGIDFRLAVLGKRPDRAPRTLVALRQHHAKQIVVDGRVSRQEYEHWLGQAAIVVSTARHEFQGLGVLEAASAGAFPLVPDDLCYREQYPQHCRYPAGNTQALAQKLRAALTCPPRPVDISGYTEASLLPRWQQALSTTRKFMNCSG